MGAVRFSNAGSGSYTIPSSNYTKNRIWVSCVGGGGGGRGGKASSLIGDYVEVNGGGGGGWGYAPITVNIAPNTNYQLNYVVGSGGAGSTSNPGFGGNSSCLGVSGLGGAGYRSTNVTNIGSSFTGYRTIPGGGFNVPSGGDGENGQVGVGVVFSGLRARAGAAGGAGRTICIGGDASGAYRSNQDLIGNPAPNRESNIVSTFTTCDGGYVFTANNGPNQCVAGGGGNGNDGTGNTVTGDLGSISPINQTFRDEEGDIRGVRATAIAGDGIYGGGGSFSTGGNFSDSGDSIFISQISVETYIQGRGGDGVVYVSWIDLTVSKTTLRSNEPITVSWNSPVDSGSQTVSYTNNGTTNITETFTKTDSRGAQSTITFTILPAVRITSFTANPNPQTSGLDGVPNFDTALTWTSIGATSASINQGIGTVAGNGSTTITDLPQSVAGSNSPATRTYTLTASDGFTTDTETLTVSVFNDNTPNNYSIPNQSNLESETFYVINVGTITGIDMVTNVIGGPGVTVSKNNQQNYVSSINIVNGDSVQLRFRSDFYNTNPSGQPTAPKSLYIDIGPTRRFFTASTRAPDVNETFNLPDETGRVPFPDIDTINEPSVPYILSDTLSIDDIELQDPYGVEIKTDNGNVQVSINGGPWQDVRSI